MNISTRVKRWMSFVALGVLISFSSMHISAEEGKSQQESINEIKTALDAVKKAVRSLESNNISSNEYYKLAQEFSNKGCWYKASIFYQRACNIEPCSKILRVAYADALMYSGNLLQARKQYSFALTLPDHQFVDDANIYIELSIIEALLGDTSKAKLHLKKSKESAKKKYGHHKFDSIQRWEKALDSWVMPNVKMSSKSKIPAAVIKYCEFNDMDAFTQLIKSHFDGPIQKDCTEEKSSPKK